MIERILALSVRHRWLVVLLTCAAAIWGAWSLARLPIDAVPDITNNQVQINTVATALSPEEIEKQVTLPVETALAGIPGLEYTRSMSRNGFSQVTAVFADRTDIYFARQQVGERLTEVRRGLPSGAEPRLGPITTGLGEIYVWLVRYLPGRTQVQDGQPGWQSDGAYLTVEGELLRTDIERAAYLRTVQDWIIQPQLRQVSGVAGIDAIGGHVKQYHVLPHPERLRAFELTLGDVAEAIERSNSSIGAGSFERSGEGYVVRAGGRLNGMNEIGEVVVVTRNGTPVRVKDVAEVAIGGELRSGTASENGEEAVAGTALMRIGENSRLVAAAVDAKIRDVNRTLPPGIEAHTVLNRTALVDATIRTVSINLAVGALLVIAVLFLLLGNFRAALIAALVIPVTMMLTAAGMLQGHISANLMSLGALDFGLIVDGAVVISENCLRRMAERQKELGRNLTQDERLATVVAASREMITPTVYGQAIIILVYVPLLTFSGVEGKMFEPMAATVIIALIAAFLLSITMVPALIAILVSGRVSEDENSLVRALKHPYGPLLRWALRWPIAVVAVAVVLFSTAVLSFTKLGQEFIPTLDEHDILLQAIRIPSTALDQAQRMQFDLEKTLSTLPEVAYVFSKTGTGESALDPMPPNISDTYVMLKPRAAWPDPALPKPALVEKVEKAAAPLPGNSFEFTQPIQMRFNELLAGVRSDLAIKVFGDAFEPMLASANGIATVVRGIAGAVDVRVEQSSGLPFFEITVNKAEIARLGLSLAAVHDVISAAIGGRDAGVMFEGDRRFEIVVRLPEHLRADPRELENLPVMVPKPGGSNVTVPLRDIATFTFNEGPNQITRENGKRRVVVTANVRGRDIASVVAEAQDKVAARVRLPAGYWIAWGGQFENLTAARERLLLVVPACFLMILLLLYAAMGSLRDAFLVFSAVPLALTGGVAALWLREMPFSVSAAVGFIALSGIAVLNGLVMVTHIRHLIATGVVPHLAIYEGAMTRFRPVAMTALVASLGFVPMALATGAGAEVQRPLATVVIGGLISATLLTLLVIPALYRLVHGYDVGAAKSQIGVALGPVPLKE